MFNPSGQLNIFGEKVEKGNKIFGTPYDKFQEEAKEFGMTVQELCERARYDIIENEEGKFAVKLQ